MENCSWVWLFGIILAGTLFLFFTGVLVFGGVNDAIDKQNEQIVQQLQQSLNTSLNTLPVVE